MINPSQTEAGRAASDMSLNAVDMLQSSLPLLSAFTA